MGTTTMTPEAAALFVGKEPAVAATYERLLVVLAALGPFAQDAKKTSIHLTHGVGFAGVHPRKSFLVLNLRLDRALTGERIAKSEQVSRHRYHNEVKLITPDAVDAEIGAWLAEAYALA